MSPYGRALRRSVVASVMSVTTAVFAAAMPACTSSPVGGSGASGGSGGSGGTAGAGGRAVITGSGGAASGGPGGASSGGKAAGAAAKLGRTPHFLIGMGNDLDNDHNKDGAYTLGVTMDLHDAYLVGAAPGKGGWPEWNAGGAFVNVLSDSAAAHGTTPMYTLYSMAALGDGNLSGLGTDAFMTWYWSDAKLLFQRIALFGKPALVHVEPDFWAYAQQAAAAAGGPQKVKVRISGLAADCAGLPEDLTGLGHCFIKLARTYAPLALVGFHASRWAGPTADMITFLAAIGATESDVIVEDMLDRDAGCFEAHVDPSCQRNDGPWYWDESNQTTPNFHEYLAWSKAIGDGLGKPVVWWQVPFGVPSPSPGGTPGHYRDDRVHYIFNHIDEFLAAGGLGVAFGTGAGNQTYIDTDGNQFRDAVARYFASPVPLP